MIYKPQKNRLLDTTDKRERWQLQTPQQNKVSANKRATVHLQEVVEVGIHLERLNRWRLLVVFIRIHVFPYLPCIFSCLYIIASTAGGRWDRNCMNTTWGNLPRASATLFSGLYERREDVKKIEEKIGIHKSHLYCHKFLHSLTTQN